MAVSKSQILVLEAIYIFNELGTGCILKTTVNSIVPWPLASRPYLANLGIIGLQKTNSFCTCSLRLMLA